MPLATPRFQDGRPSVDGAWLALLAKSPPTRRSEKAGQARRGKAKRWEQQNNPLPSLRLALPAGSTNITAARSASTPIPLLRRPGIPHACASLAPGAASMQTFGGRA
ncbi:hypothetical protein BST61_g10778 [Cercospora zeina]